MLPWQLYIALVASFQGTIAYDVPSNLQSFYQAAFDQQNCPNTLKDGFSIGDGGANYSYCETSNVLYVHRDVGGLAVMSIDVDGHRPPGDNPPDSQNGTAFGDILASYNITNGTDQISEFNPYVHPYIVLGNQGTKPGYVTFDPTEYGIEPVSVVAVVCNGSMFFGIWGDTNGDDDWPSYDGIGEASEAMGNACFGDAVNADVAHSQTDVLYVAFKGIGAVPGADGAKWNASSFDEFEASIANLGKSLVANITSSVNFC